MASNKTTRPRRQKTEQVQQQAGETAEQKTEAQKAAETVVISHARLLALITQSMTAAKGLKSNVSLRIGRLTVYLSDGLIDGTTFDEGHGAFATAEQMIEEGTALTVCGLISDNMERARRAAEPTWDGGEF